jgi:16S rRNA (guanine527-N7)-methyltransferase
MKMGVSDSRYLTDTIMTEFCLRLKQGSKKINIHITQDQIALMAAHANELIKWNKKINLTAIVDPLAMAEKHFIDAIAVQPFLNQADRNQADRNQEKKIMDMGTGGGFPSLPLKILSPSIQFTLVDSSRKKVNFLKHVIRTLGLDNIDAIHSRVEDLAFDDSHAKSFDAVMSRGFAGLEKFVGLALPLLKPGGKIYALKGKQAEEEVTPALRSRFEIRIDHYLLPFERSDRYMVQLKLPY